jgi:hypothetical protein
LDWQKQGQRNLALCSTQQRLLFARFCCYSADERACRILSLEPTEVLFIMQEKIIVTLLIGAFPYIILPLYVLYFLRTRLPEPYSFFFTDYSPLLISIWYALPFLGVGLYWLIKKRRSRAQAKGGQS